MLFTENNHSRWQVGWKDVSAECCTKIVDLARRYYAGGISDVSAVCQADAWEEQSRNYRVIGKDAGGNKKTVLFRQNVSADDGDLITQMLVMEHLSLCGVPAPRIIPARGDASFVRAGGAIWQMFTFIPGDHFRGTEDELTQAAEAVARLHKALRAFLMKEDVPHIDIAIGPLDAAYWDGISGLRRKNEFEMMLRRRKAMIQDSVSAAAEALAATTQTEEVIHCDIHPHNFLFPPETAPVIIDFGNMCRADQRYDIAMACHRLARQYVVYQQRPLQESLAEGVELFLHAYGSVIPLCDQCIKALPIFARGLIFRKMAYNFWRYVEGARNWEVCLSQFQRFFLFLDEIEEMEKILA